MITPAIKDTLNYLFEGYCSSGGTGIFSLKEMAEKHEIAAEMLLSALNKTGWIKNPQFGPLDFACQISIAGIQKNQPNYFSNLISASLAVAGLVNDWVGLIESIPFERKDYQRAHDLGKVFENLNLAEVQFQFNEVYIRPTLFGMERYQQEYSGGFMNL